MSKRPFKSQASSSRLDPASSFGGFGSVFAGSTLSYVSEPPGLSSITDANVVVAFKTLTKKDSTTKSKGLEDLRSNVLSHPYEKDGGVEQPILEAWVKLYPRISIDNSRRVRELSHNLQYELLKSARKRMEKYIPAVVGPWLAGMYDRDRPVSRAAIAGINSFLDSEDKVLSFWRRCQPQILAYAQEAIKETPQTLSDERNVSVDDAQAKYDRVMGSSLSLVMNLLVKLDSADTLKQREAYEEFFSSNKFLWGFIASQDSSLRRTSAQLLSVCLDKVSEVVEQNLETVSHAFLVEGLRSPQNGSALLFLEALNKTTDKFPDIWLAAYRGKKSALSRLRHFVGKGSQGGPPQFWQSLSSLILSLPRGVLQTDLDGAVDFLKAYREGISSREEARTNASAAWNSYLSVVRYFGSHLPDSVTFERFLGFAVFPAFDEFLHPVPNHVSWSMENSIATLPKLFHLCYLPDSSKLPQSLRDEWIRLAESMITRMRTSLPEQSKEHAKSQVAITVEANRWFGLQASIITSANEPESKLSEDFIIDYLKDPFSKIIINAIDVLRVRSGKLDGAAGTLEAALRLTPKLFHAIPSIQDVTASFLESEFPKLILSPSSKHIISALYSFQSLPNRELQFKAIWQAAVDGLTAAPDNEQKMTALKRLIANHSTSQLARQDPALQGHLLERISRLIKAHDEDWSVFELLLTFDVLDMDTSDSVVSTIVDSLNDQAGSLDAALRALEVIVQKKPQMLHGGEQTHITIMTRLLALTESSARSVVSRANLLKAQIEGAGEGLATQNLHSSSTLDIIQDNLENAGLQSLAIDTLVRQAEDFLEVEHGSKNPKLFPNVMVWSQAIKPLLDCSPNSSLSLMSSVGPGVVLVRPMSDSPILKLSRDIHGFSIPFRMALYTSKLLSRETRLVGLPVNDRVDILRLLSMTVLLASDQLGLGEQNKLWSSLLDLDVESQIVDFLNRTEVNIALQLKDASSWRSGDAAGSSAVAQKLVVDLLEASNGDSPFAFYSARALNSLVTKLTEEHSWKAFGSDEWLSSLNILKTSTPNVFAGLAILSGLQEYLGTSKLVSNLCNRLLSDITDALAMDEKTLPRLLLLNATLTIYEPQNLPIAQNRVMFAVKHLTEWMHEDKVLPLSTATETLQSLRCLMPSLSALYGPHWGTVVNYCVRLWNYGGAKYGQDEQLAALDASMRLITLLKELQDPNEDLSEALEKSAVLLSNGLIQLFILKGRCDNQPWRIFDEFLWRQSSKIPSQRIKEISALYPLIASGFKFVQLATFDILNRTIPAAQEQISIDVILEKRDAQIPEELLSLLLDAPSIRGYSDEDLARFPSSIKTYLFSWKLVFSLYPDASYKVRSDYNEALRAGNYVDPLLDFLFDVLGHSVGQPLNLGKARITVHDIQSYDIKLATSDSEEHHLWWLLVYLYHECLKFAPSLTKSWWMNCKSKQTRIAVESWTEQYFSSLIIAHSFDEIENWVAQQEAAPEDEKEMIVKISKNSREVYAGFEVDEMLMQIVIRLPRSYPLEGVKVEGIKRVAVSEKKWQSWLMITQGVITFSNSSLIEGLLAFRKNVTGALKGQTECAICYSIISSDKKMPDKRCQTCNNLFHASCLFRWFSSSNQSSCPLCRNPFNYGAGLDVASRARRRGGPE